MLTPAPVGGVGAEGAVTVAAAGLVRPGEAERGGVGNRPDRWPRRELGHREQQVIIAETVLLGVGLDLRDDGRAEPEPPVFPVLRVVLDEEPAAVRVEPRARLDDHPAHRQDPGAEVQVPWPQFGELAPAQPA
jgi:hypothetical protein